METNETGLKQEDTQENGEGKLQVLSCSNCGAPLDFDDKEDQQLEKGDLIKCKYCGQTHQFVSPAAVSTPGEHNYKVDQPVLVQWGHRWWKARVLKIVDGQNWLIHYENWSDSWDEVVGTDRIAPRPVKQNKPSAGKWIAAAVILVIILAAVFITNYKDGDVSPDPPGQATSVQPPASQGPTSSTNASVG